MLWVVGVLGAIAIGAIGCLNLARVEEDDPDRHLDAFLDEHGPWLTLQTRRDGDHD